MRNKIKHRTKYKIGKSPTLEGKISIVLFTRQTPNCFCLHSIERFPAIYFSIAEVNIRFIHMQRISAVFQMYFIIKYNVFNKYIINVTTTEINTRKNIFEFGQREVISFFTLVTNKGEHSIIYSK